MSGRSSLESLGFERSFPAAIIEATNRIDRAISERATRRNRIIPIAIAKGNLNG